jgi:hypothetical protein
MDSVPARTRSGENVPTDPIAPLKPNPGLSGPPATLEIRIFSGHMTSRHTAQPRRIKTRKQIMIIVIVIGLACNRQVSPDRLARSGLQQFREIYNAGECKRVHEIASTNDQGLQAKFERGCEELRARAGQWHKIISERQLSLPGQATIVLVEGSGEFTTGVHGYQAYWRIEGQTPRLEYLGVTVGGDTIVLPQGARRHMPELPSTSPVPEGE